MEDDASVRKLVELIFSKEFEEDEEKSALDSSIPTCLLTNDFPIRLQFVLCFKQIICQHEWVNRFKTYSSVLFSSPGTYLKCVVFVCVTETTCHENVFEIFVSVCALLRLFNDSILHSIGMDFRDLNTDVFMAVYDDILKSKFFEMGGFQQLAEFIHGHRYLSWKCKDINAADAATHEEILEDFKGERESYSYNRKTADELKAIKEKSFIMLQKVLSTTSFKFPTLSNNPDSIKDLKVSGDEEKAEKSGKERIMKGATGSTVSDATSQGCSSSNSDSRTYHIINLPDNMPLLGQTILRVLRHYHARFSGYANLDNSIQKADGSM